MDQHENYWGVVRIRNPKTLRKWIKRGEYQRMINMGWIFNPCCGRFRLEKCTCTKCRHNRGGSKLQAVVDEHTKNHLLFMAWAYADHEDKSTEWMMQYMQDFADATYDEVLLFLRDYDEDRKTWYDTNPDWLNEMFAINERKLKELENE